MAVRLKLLKSSDGGEGLWEVGLVNLEEPAHGGPCVAQRPVGREITPIILTGSIWCAGSLTR